MFSEFFSGSGPTTALVAWSGLIVVFGYSIFLAWIKARINDFYSDFYDLMQASGTVLGDYSSGSEPPLASYRAQVWEQLARFGGIVAPLVMAAPAAKWVRSAWAFAWRAALMRAYLKAWDVSKEPIEGASQRLHEDTQRFCNALQGCIAALLDAVFTLAVFTPILIGLSAQVTPPADLDLGPLRCAWLLMAALTAALVGLGGAVLFGQELVQLEVNNQKVEAELRKDLVLLETTPVVIVGRPCFDFHPNDPVAQGAATPQVHAPWLFFGATLKRLRKNYHALFRHFSLLNFWLTLFDQFMVIFPYLVAAPLLFADEPSARITLGTLVKMSNSFDKVFGSLSVVAENWGAVNEFRSVLRRLREFEAKLYLHVHRRSTNCLLPVPSADGGGGGGRSESLRHTRTRAATAEEREVAFDTELVLVEGGPVEVRTTYGEEPDDDLHQAPAFPNTLHDMRV